MSKNQKGTSFSLPEDDPILEVLGMWEDKSMANEDIDKVLYGEVNYKSSFRKIGE